MGIKGLTNQIKEKAPESVRVEQLKNYFGRIIAIDASTAIYQFLIAVRTGEDGNQLKNQMGEVTSHLQGMFYRTIRLIVNGIKPVYVFDGKAPEFKSEELAKRREKREKAQADFEKAKEAGDSISSAKFQKRTVRATKEHVEDCKRLLKLMGIPYIEAPSEAEAQCAVLCKSKKVYAVASEDMDTLTFGSPRMIRNLTSSQAKQKQILEFDLEKVLKSFKLTMDQFIDFSILCGCDYTDTIAGVGNKRALELIQKHKNIEKILKAIASHKAYRVSENFRYEEARNLFKNPQVIDPNEITFKWSDPDPQGLIEYLCKEKGFQQERIEKGIEKLQKARKEPVQSRLDSFFSMRNQQKPQNNQKQNNQKQNNQTKNNQREKEQKEKEQKEKEQKEKEQKKEQREKEEQEKEQKQKEKERENKKVDQKVDQKVEKQKEKEQKEKERENKKEKRKNHSKKRKKKKDLKKDSVKKEKQQKQKRKTRSSKRK